MLHEILKIDHAVPFTVAHFTNYDVQGFTGIIFTRLTLQLLFVLILVTESTL